MIETVLGRSGERDHLSALPCGEFMEQVNEQRSENHAQDALT